MSQPVGVSLAYGSGPAARYRPSSICAWWIWLASSHCVGNYVAINAVRIVSAETSANFHEHFFCHGMALPGDGTAAHFLAPFGQPGGRPGATIPRRVVHCPRWPERLDQPPLSDCRRAIRVGHHEDDSWAGGPGER